MSAAYPVIPSRAVVQRRHLEIAPTTPPLASRRDLYENVCHNAGV